MLELMKSTDNFSDFDGLESEDSIEVEGVESKIIDIFELNQEVGPIAKKKSHYFNCVLGPPSI